MTTFKTGKEQNLHSLSLSPDCENFLATDKSRIWLWNLERSGQNPVYSLIDYNRDKVSDDDEQITSAKFSQDGRGMFLYSTNTGHINVCDFRESSNFHKSPSLSFKVPSRKVGSNLFDKWINVVSDAQFVPGHDHAIVSRDYTSLRMWDMRTASSNNSITGMVVDSEPQPVYSA